VQGHKGRSWSRRSVGFKEACKMVNKHEEAYFESGGPRMTEICREEEAEYLSDWRGFNEKDGREKWVSTTTPLRFGGEQNSTLYDSGNRIFKNDD